jgi:hypothetical protein
MKLAQKQYLVTSNFLHFGHADLFETKEEAVKFAVEKGNKIVWHKPTGKRAICPHDKAVRVF